MDHHPYFDLRLHTGSELAELLHGQVIGRETLHEWPLSCVQRVVVAGSDGTTTYIYKSASGPTVEADFYAAARSPALVQAQTLYREGPYSCLLLEDVATHALPSTPLDALAVQRAGADLLALIAGIEGAPPVYQDFHTLDRWLEWVDGLEADLRHLVATGAYQQVTVEAARRITALGRSDAVRALWDGPTGLMHNDLTVENIFRLLDGYKILDWQRPVLGPPAVDLVQFALSAGIDPLPLVGLGAVRCHHLLRAGWLVACSLRWFPPGIPTYDRTIAEMAVP